MSGRNAPWCGRVKSCEAAAVYVFARAMAVTNVKRLAFCAGMPPPADANALVIERERSYGGEDFAGAVYSTAAATVLVGACIADVKSLLGTW